MKEIIKSRKSEKVGNQKSRNSEKVGNQKKLEIRKVGNKKKKKLEEKKVVIGLLCWTLNVQFFFLQNIFY